MEIVVDTTDGNVTDSCCVTTTSNDSATPKEFLRRRHRKVAQK